MSDLQNPMRRIFWLMLVGTVVAVIAWATFPSILVGISSAGPPELGADPEVIAVVAHWFFFIVVMLLLMVTAYAGVAALRGVDPSLEWQAISKKQEKFSELVDDLGDDQYLGIHNETERILLAAEFTRAVRGTIRSLIDAKRLSKGEASMRGIDELTLTTTSKPSVTVRQWRQYDARAANRIAERRTDRGVVA